MQRKGASQQEESQSAKVGEDADGAVCPTESLFEQLSPSGFVLCARDKIKAKKKTPAVGNIVR